MLEMKESGIPWVGMIPNTWKVDKNKHCFSLEKNIVGDKMINYDLLSLTKKGIIKKDESSTGGKVPESFETYQSVKIGQLVMCLFDLDVSAVFSGLSSYNGMISPAYKVYNCNKNIDKDYAKYWFECCFDGRKYKAYSKSLRYVVNTEDFGPIEILLPPIDEQQKIADYLDKKVVEIDNVIEKTRETIEDYKKYKQLIITETITKGLDKNVEMKDSGVEFIGKININYNVLDFKYLLKENMQYGANKSGITYDETLPRYVRITDINENGELKNDGMLSLSEEDSQNYILKDGDILFARSGATVGKSFIYDKKYGRCAFAGYLIKASVKNMILPKYIYYYTLSNIYDIWKNGIFIQATIQNIGAEKYMNMPIIFSKNIKEQSQIISYLDGKCKEIDNLIYNKQNIIDELEQYKKSLIYEYVTGKKEVKENNLLKKNDTEEIKINCKDNIFAQAILLCKIIEKLSKYNLGRVKAEKTLYLIEKDIGFNFNNNYVREAAGPLSEAIYKCESIISKKNKWIKVNKVRKHIEYEILSDFSKYNKYYEKYYSGYDNQIENIISIIKNYSTDKSEMVATLYASWNDFIIKKEEISDIKIVKDVRENWNDTKKRFKENEWLDVLKEMKQVGLIPKGNGNLTIIKEQ